MWLETLSTLTTASGSSPCWGTRVQPFMARSLGHPVSHLLCEHPAYSSLAPAPVDLLCEVVMPALTLCLGNEVVRRGVLECGMSLVGLDELGQLFVSRHRRPFVHEALSMSSLHDAEAARLVLMGEQAACRIGAFSRRRLSIARNSDALFGARGVRLNGVRVMRKPDRHTPWAGDDSGCLAPQIEEDAEHNGFGERPVEALDQHTFECLEGVAVVDLGECDLVSEGDSPEQFVVGRVRTTCSIHDHPEDYEPIEISRGLGLHVHITARQVLSADSAHASACGPADLRVVDAPRVKTPRHSRRSRISSSGDVRHVRRATKRK
jgi:hypothetical protein